MKDWEIVRALNRMDAYQCAANGDGILSNPNEYGTPAFNHWVDGWCAYWSNRSV